MVKSVVSLWNLSPLTPPATSCVALRVFFWWKIWSHTIDSFLYHRKGRLNTIISRVERRRIAKNRERVWMTSWTLVSLQGLTKIMREQESDLEGGSLASSNCTSYIPPPPLPHLALECFFGQTIIVTFFVHEACHYLYLLRNLLLSCTTIFSRYWFERGGMPKYERMNRTLSWRAIHLLSNTNILVSIVSRNNHLVFAAVYPPIRSDRIDTRLLVLSSARLRPCLSSSIFLPLPSLPSFYRLFLLFLTQKSFCWWS